MNSSTSPGGTQAPKTSRPENEDDDPVGDNRPVGESTGADVPEDEEEDASNSGAVRTGNDKAEPARQSSDVAGAAPPEELPEGSDVPPSDRLNDHHLEEFLVAPLRAPALPRQQAAAVQPRLKASRPFMNGGAPADAP